MTLRELKKTAQVTEFIAQGGTPADDNTYHRLTVRIPKWLLFKVDAQRKERTGSVSRNLWILELIEKATR